MREAHRKPTSTGMSITEEKTKALDELGFEWENVQIRSFEQCIEQLKAFKEAHGHLRVTMTLDKNLSTFCHEIARRNPTSAGRKITEERIKALDELGFGWNAKQQLTKVQTLSAETNHKCAEHDHLSSALS